MASFFPADNIENLPNERWAFIKGYNQKYAISDYGRVKSYKHKKVRLLSQSFNSQGYPIVELWKNNERKHWLVHRLVALAFIPNSNPEVNKVIDHLDSNRKNSHYTNLQWTTQSENIKKTYQRKA